MATTNDPIISKKLGNYNIVELLGKGGMARVYRGFDAKLNRYAAVKVFEAHLIPEQEQEEYRRRFENEARAIARLRHPNVVGVYQFDQVGTVYYMAMEYIEGRDLRQILRNHAKNNTRMAYSEILRVIQDTGTALDYAHQEAVIHRDVKPSNIMVTSSGKAILTDFGLALSLPEGTQGMTFGSAHYIAPEQAVSSAQAVPQSDLYSLGIVLFEMLTNRVPFNDPSAMSVAMKHLSEPPPPPSQFNPNLSQAIDHVVLKALAKEPANRFASGAEMAQALAVAFTGVSEPDADDTNEADLLESWGAPLAALAGSRPSQPASTDSRSTVRPPQTPSLVRAADIRLPISEPLSQASLPRILPPPLPVRPAKKRQMALVIGLAVLGLVFILAAVALVAASSGGSNSLTPTLSSTRQPAIAAAATASPAPEETPVPTEATAEATAAVIEPTAEASPAATPEAVTVTTDGVESPVLLRYDAKSLVLLNRSNRRVNVSGLEFVQVRADGSKLVFDSQRWEGGTRSTRALPARNCFQVQRNDIAQLAEPDYCELQSWARVSFPRWFWTSDDPDAVFEVQREGVVLATCPVSAGECALKLED
ncbi:MAG: serine/threonine protein kinase [Chloroflexi bacterium]|nr:serine/threonine protein kinase [Chloroflexota bacterium]